MPKVSKRLWKRESLAGKAGSCLRWLKIPPGLYLGALPDIGG